jgi:hypothetical protein
MLLPLPPDTVEAAICGEYDELPGVLLKLIGGLLKLAPPSVLLVKSISKFSGAI